MRDLVTNNLASILVVVGAFIVTAGLGWALGAPWGVVALGVAFVVAGLLTE